MFSRGNAVNPACCTLVANCVGGTPAPTGPVLGAVGPLPMFGFFPPFIVDLTRAPAGAVACARSGLLATAAIAAGVGPVGVAAVAVAPTAGAAWFAAQLANSAGVTVNTLNRMFAWLVP